MKPRFLTLLFLWP